MSENNIYEITRMIQNQNIVEKDLNEAAGMVMGMFRNKYINRINEAVTSKHLTLRENPPKEVHLLNALKPFMPADNHSQMDNIIDMLLMAHTMQDIQGEIQAVSVQNHNNVEAAAVEQPPVEETSIHEDGIYDIDSKCMLRKQGGGMGSNSLFGIFLLMAMQGGF